MAAQSIAIANGACQIYVQANDAATPVSGWTPVYYRGLTFTDNSVNKDVTTSEQRANGVQFLASVNTALGFTLELDCIRSEMENAVALGTLDPGQERIIQIWASGNGINRIKFWKLVFPENSGGLGNTEYGGEGTTGTNAASFGSADAFVFRANLETLIPLGGTATDEATFRINIKTYGIVDFFEGTLPAFTSLIPTFGNWPVTAFPTTTLFI